MSIIISMPDVLTSIPEVKFCYDFAQDMAVFFENEIAKAERETDTETASESGIARKEKMFGIIPSVTDTIEERRFCVLLRERRTRLLNFDNLKSLIKDVAGDDSSVGRDEKRRTLTVRIPLSSKKSYEIVKALCEKYIPVTMNCVVTQLYNRWEDFEDSKFGDLKDNKFNTLRELETGRSISINGNNNE